MELRVLGCSGGEAEGERLTGFLINGRVAIDAGSLTLALTIPEQVAIRQVFISHSHLDHICTLPFYTKNIYGHIQESVQIRALPETLAALRRHLFNDEIWPDFSALPSPANPIIRYTEIAPRETYEVEGLRITPIAVNHLVPTVGFKVEDDHSAIIFTSDTGPTDEIYAIANDTPNLKLFITEASFPDELDWLADVSRHLTPAGLARELRKLTRPDVTVGVYHMTPGDRPAMLPQLAALGDPRIHILAQDEIFTW